MNPAGKVPLSEFAIPVVTDIIFRAAQLLTLDLDLDEARAAHRQIVEAHVNAANPAHADVDALEQAGEVHRRVTGQAGEAAGGLFHLYTLTIVAVGIALSRGAGRKQERVAQPAAKTPKGQPIPQRSTARQTAGTPQTTGQARRPVDSAQPLRDTTGNRAPSRVAAVRAPWGRRIRQRSDIDWDFVRPEGTTFAGQTNRAAAQQGYSPVRINPRVGYVGADDDPLEVAGYRVPTAVVQAARRQAAGQGDYVDEQGMSIQAF
jgi:hypothetical protein